MSRAELSCLAFFLVLRGVKQKRRMPQCLSQERWQGTAPFAVLQPLIHRSITVRQRELTGFCDAELSLAGLLRAEGPGKVLKRIGM